MEKYEFTSAVQSIAHMFALVHLESLTPKDRNLNLKVKAYQRVFLKVMETFPNSLDPEDLTMFKSAIVKFSRSGSASELRDMLRVLVQFDKKYGTGHFDGNVQTNHKRAA
jgi:hypothetical protein